MRWRRMLPTSANGWRRCQVCDGPVVEQHLALPQLCLQLDASVLGGHIGPARSCGVAIRTWVFWTYMQAPCGKPWQELRGETKVCCQCTSLWQLVCQAELGRVSS